MGSAEGSTVAVAEAMAAAEALEAYVQVGVGAGRFDPGWGGQLTMARPGFSAADGRTAN